MTAHLYPEEANGSPRCPSISDQQQGSRCFVSFWESIVDYSGAVMGLSPWALMGSDGGRTMACLQRLSALLWVEMASHRVTGTQANHIFGFI